MRPTPSCSRTNTSRLRSKASVPSRRHATSPQGTKKIEPGKVIDMAWVVENTFHSPQLPGITPFSYTATTFSKCARGSYSPVTISTGHHPLTLTNRSPDNHGELQQVPATKILSLGNESSISIPFSVTTTIFSSRTPPTRCSPSMLSTASTIPGSNGCG